MIVEKESAENTAHNSEYPTTIRFAQIGSRWSPTSGTREPLCATNYNFRHSTD